MKARMFIMAAATVLMCGCSNNNKEIGKFVYIDVANCIHIEKSCMEKHASECRTQKAELIRLAGVNFVDTVNLEQSEYSPYKFCPYCISDEQYQHLEKIIENNQKRKLYE